MFMPMSLPESYERAKMTANAEHLTPMAHAAHNRCFGCGQANPTGLHLEFFLAVDGAVVCLPTIPDTYEGPTGYLHGGIIATLLDEAMSKAIRSKGIVAMTGKLEVEYLRPVPSNAPIRIEGRVTSQEGRKNWAEATILNGKGVELARGKGLFIQLIARPAPMNAPGQSR
jgi:uncharacterized protein (TIGR00369 family)